MKPAQIIPDTENIAVRELADDHCILEIGGNRLVLSFETTYELTLRLASYLNGIDGGETFAAVDRLQ